MGELDLEDLGQALKKYTDLSVEEIQEQVDAKVEEHGGLVSRKAACFLVAREHGVDLNEKLELEQDTELDVENLVEDMDDVRIQVCVDSVGDVNEFGSGDDDGGRVRNIDVSDSTGATRLTLWDEDVVIGEELSPGDEILVKGGYSKRSDYTGQVEIHVGDGAEIVDIDSGKVLKKSVGGNGS